MASTASTMAAQPTAEVVPITTMILNTLVKDKAFLFNAIIAGLLIGYYLICKSSHFYSSHCSGKLMRHERCGNSWKPDG